MKFYVIILLIFLCSCASNTNKAVQHCEFSDSLTCNGFELLINETSPTLVVFAENRLVTQMQSVVINASIDNLTVDCILNNQIIGAGNEVKIVCSGLYVNTSSNVHISLKGRTVPINSRFTRKFSGEIVVVADAGYISLQKQRTRRLILWPLVLFFCACIVFTAVTVISGARRMK